MQSGIDLAVPEPTREYLNRLQGIEDERTGWPKNARADALGSEDAQEVV